LYGTREVAIVWVKLTNHQACRDNMR